MAPINIRTVILGLALVFVAEAFKGGAPAGVCDSLTPQHGVDPQTTSFPYILSLTKKNSQILFTLKSNATNDSFKGFILQVRDATGKPIGSFNSPPDTKSIDCAPGKKNALTHNSSKEKKEIKATWTAPSDFTGGPVYPIVTVARDGVTFWVGHSPAKVEIAAAAHRH